MNRFLFAFAVALGGLTLAGCSVSGGQSTVGQFVDDATITTRVKARLADDPQVSALRIGVETLNGTVQLSGFAQTQLEKDQASRLAQSVPGVRNVRNDVVVRPAR